jgi:hypothetical protein
MRIKSTIVFFLLILAISLPVMGHGNLRFINGFWFDGDHFVKRTMYSVEKTFQSQFDGEVQQTVDLAGKYVIPPLADAHNHVLSDPRRLADDVKRVLRQGVFYIKNPNSIAQFTTELHSRLGTPETPDVTYAGGGLTASGGHPVQIFSGAGHGGSNDGGMDMNNQAYFLIDSAADLEAKWPLILGSKPDFIKLYLEHSEDYATRHGDKAFFGRYGLDPDLVAPIVARAHAAGLTTTVHVSTTADFHCAVAAGSDEVAHLPLAPIAPADAEMAAARHLTVVTTTLSHRSADGVADIPALHRQNLQLLKKAGVNVVVGVDNPQQSSIDEVLNLASLGVYSSVELLRMWTMATPHEIFPNRRLGMLADGYEASFLALDANPLEDLGAVRKISLRVKQGHIMNIPPDKPSIAEALLPVFQHQGIGAALAEYERLRKTGPERYDFSEGQLNRLGYEVLKAGDQQAALRVFQRNAKLFPDSGNVWDSLAEAYMNAGDRDAAIANYRKALKLNPKNENAAKMLAQLGAQ